GRSQASSLAALLLFLSPEFLFEATRSSHAKVTWLMALTMLSMLAKSLRSGHAPRRLAVWVALFYVAAYALITSNSFFASSYVFGFAFAFVSTYLLLSLRRTRSIATSKVHRLAYITVSSLLVVFLFIFYLYPPAQAQFDTLRSELDRLSVLFLGVEPSTGANPYTYTQATWLNFPVYLALTSFNWIVLLLSFMVWLHKGWLFWVRREHMSANEFLLWLLYGSFGFIMVLSVLADLLGLLSANLQLRIFPHFLLVGIPLASQGIVTLMSRLGRSRRAWLAKVAPALLAVTFAFFALASLLKITNEPLLSHWWTFHSDDERMAVQWVESSVRNNAIWIGRDARLGTLVDNYGGWSQSSIWIERALQPVNSRYVLLSDILRMQASRME
ncbi:MAG TPA: hypothetical protein PK071_06105, partial [Atopobiaceae bacterium]|nr:hypothetical protein [Atopobiaceae bacterium]